MKILSHIWYIKVKDEFMPMTLLFESEFNPRYYYAIRVLYNIHRIVVVYLDYDFNPIGHTQPLRAKKIYNLIHTTKRNIEIHDVVKEYLKHNVV